MIKRIYFLLLLFFVSFVGIAQESDFQVWGDVSAKYKWNKKISFATELSLRSRENSQLLKQYYVEFGGKYKLNKRWALGSKYRFTNYFLQGKTAVHRVNADIYYRFKKWGRFRMKIRERYQYERFVSDYKNEYDEHILRSRFHLSYNIKKNKMEPFISLAHYWGLNGEHQFKNLQMRYTLGVLFPINKWSDLEIAYRIEREFYRNQPHTNYILMMSYGVDLN